MERKTILKALNIAKQGGFEYVRHLGKWKGYEVFEPEYTDDEIRYTGYPQFLLAKEGKIRWTKDSDESLAIMRSFR